MMESSRDEEALLLAHRAVAATPEDAVRHLDYARFCLLAAKQAENGSRAADLTQRALNHGAIASRLCPLVWEPHVWMAQEVSEFESRRTTWNMRCDFTQAIQTFPTSLECCIAIKWESKLRSCPLAAFTTTLKQAPRENSSCAPRDAAFRFDRAVDPANAELQLDVARYSFDHEMPAQGRRFATEALRLLESEASGDDSTQRICYVPSASNCSATKIRPRIACVRG